MKRSPTVICAALLFFGLALITANLVFAVPVGAMGAYGLIQGDIGAAKGAVVIIMTVCAVGSIMAALPLLFVSVFAALIHAHLPTSASKAHILVTILSALCLPIILLIDQNPMWDWKFFTVFIPLISGLVGSFGIRFYFERMREQDADRKPDNVVS